MPAFGLVNTVFNFFGNQSPKVITCNVPAPAVGKRFVSITTGGTEQVPNVAQTGAGLHADGVLDGDVSAADVTAKDTRRALWQESSGITVTAGASIAAGQGVQSDAQGRAIPLAAGIRLGTALAPAASGEDAAIKLEL